MARILIVEDERIVAWNIRATLNQLGHEVPASITSKAEVLRATAEVNPDLVLIALGLEEEQEGLGVAETLWQQYRIPSVYLSIDADSLSVARAISREAFGYLVRPFQPTALQAVIELALHRYQQGQTELAEHKRIEAVLKQQAQRAAALHRVIQAIRSSLDLTIVFSTAVSEVGSLLAIDRAAIVQYLPESKLWLHVADYRKDPHTASALGIVIPDQGNELTAQLKQLQIVQIDEEETQPEAISHRLSRQMPGAWLMVPLPIGPVVWGYLSLVKTSQPTTWQSWEVDLTQAIADQVAIAIQQSELHQQVQTLNAQLEDRVKERTAQLRLAFEFEATLKRITDKVRDSLDETQIMQAAVRELAQAIRVRGCNASLYNLDTETAVIRYEHTTLGHSHRDRVIAMASYPEIYRQLLQNQSVQFCSASPNPQRGKMMMLAVPITDNQGVLGDLWLINQGDYRFSEQEIRLVQQVATQCAIALRQARLYQTAQTQVAELERLDRLKDDFLNTVSHELRTPMASVKLATEMLEIVLKRKGWLESDPDIPRYFQILRDQGQQEINLINDLLDLSRLDAGADPLMVTPIDPRTWLLHQIEPFMERACYHQQHVQIQIPEHLPLLTTDLCDLERILSELLTNACKFTPDGETIVVSASVAASKPPTRLHSADLTPAALMPPPTASLLISVTNTGVEIPVAEQGRIFDKFYRIPRSDPWKYAGTGLGLALVKKLTQRLHGTIQVESAAGQTTFTIRLPLTLPESLR